MNRNENAITGVRQRELPHCSSSTLPKRDADSEERERKNKAFAWKAKSHRPFIRKVAVQIGFHGAKLEREINVNALSYLRGYLPQGRPNIQASDGEGDISDASQVQAI